jgi:glycogen phosphorylase
LGDGQEHSNIPAWDAIEANALYELLEQEVIPEFYQRDAQALPRAWLQRIRESMGQLTPRFSVMRTLREYTEQRYVPAAIAYQQRAAANGMLAEKIVSAQSSINQHWEQIHFGARRDTENDGQQTVEVEIYLGGLTDQQVALELYADATATQAVARHPMFLREHHAGSTPHIYYACIADDHRLATDFTVRVMVHIEGVPTPLEDAHIRWQE